MTFVPVAISEGIKIYCPEKGLYSFFNSPYPAHRLTTGIDIYPNTESLAATSPVSGIVTKVKRVNAPKGMGFRDEGFDVVTLIQSSENPNKMVKILHVNPSLSEGQEVKIGDTFGTLIRSGYYGWATSPHVHVEVRDPSDPLRARGGYEVYRTTILRPQKQVKELSGIVSEVRPEYIIVTFNDATRYGLVANIGGRPGVLDGGIPYYGWFGAHYSGDNPRGFNVSLCDVEIGAINKVGHNWCQAKNFDLRMRVNGIPIRGISLRLSPNRRSQLKIVPFRQGDLKIDLGSSINLELTKI